MKTSIILSILIAFNTTALLAQPLAQVIQGINGWVFAAIEGLLLLGYYLNAFIKDLRKRIEIDFKNLNVFVVESKKLN